jgi:hypothetical protein
VTARKKSDDQRPPPVIHIAPLGELKAYTVHEHELDTLSRGSTASVFLNFALFLLPISVTLVVALLTTTIESDRLFQAFVSLAAITFIVGAILLILWWREHKSSRSLVREIKSRMPPQPAIQQTAADEGKGTETATVEKKEPSEGNS